jgi:uncharacterized protein YjbI with pentapeptide repeats
MLLFANPQTAEVAIREICLNSRARCLASFGAVYTEITLPKLRLPGNELLAEIKDMSGKVLLALGEETKTLDDLDLTGAMLDRIRADGLICMGTRFDKATFRDADLYWLSAFRASFRNAVLDGCVFRGANLEQADFDGASLRNAKFLLSNLGGRTSLSGANLFNAVIDGAEFTGASYDPNTKFPPSFDPAEHGLVKEQTDD